jgi:hypothetical protein
VCQRLNVSKLYEKKMILTRVNSRSIIVVSKPIYPRGIELRKRNRVARVILIKDVF